MNTNETLPKIAEDITALIGGTPMLRVRNLDTGPCTLLLKLECQNPGNSIKDRIAISMINRAEEEGRLQPGEPFMKAPQGTPGSALALVGVSRGYKVKVVMPDKMSAGKISHLKRLRRSGSDSFRRGPRAPAVLPGLGPCSRPRRPQRLLHQSV